MDLRFWYRNSKWSLGRPAGMKLARSKTSSEGIRQRLWSIFSRRQLSDVFDTTEHSLKQWLARRKFAFNRSTAAKAVPGIVGDRDGGVVNYRVLGPSKRNF